LKPETNLLWNPHLRVAGFESTPTGWFSTDRRQSLPHICSLIWRCSDFRWFSGCKVNQSGDG